jgi:fatty-acyl-CoA synthase
VKGLTSDYQLTLPAMLKRAVALYGPKEIVTRRPDKGFHRYTYADFVRRAKKLTGKALKMELRERYKDYQPAKG